MKNEEILKNKQTICKEGKYLLEDGAVVELFPKFLTSKEALNLFLNLKDEIPWEQCVGKFGPVPRLNAWNSEVGLDYSYSGITHIGKGWHPLCAMIRDLIKSETGYEFNSLLLNYYRNGGDSIGKHSDGEPPLGLNPVVASLSLGVSRKFKLIHQTKKEGNQYLRHDVNLTSGALLIMAGTLQHTWYHELPKEPEVIGERISLTFRKIL